MTSAFSLRGAESVAQRSGSDALHPEGRRFEPCIAHQNSKRIASRGVLPRKGRGRAAPSSRDKPLHTQRRATAEVQLACPTGNEKAAPEGGPSATFLSDLHVPAARGLHGPGRRTPQQDSMSCGHPSRIPSVDHYRLPALSGCFVDLLLKTGMRVGLDDSVLKH